MRKPWVSIGLACSLAALLLVGCTKANLAPADNGELAQLKAENQQLKTEKEQLQSQAKELEDRLAAPAGGKNLQLVDKNYPPAVAGSAGWPYVKQAVADLDGDGDEEKLLVTTSAGWDAQHGTWGWDDGQPWHVYVEEPDGTRTYLFSGWVQLGRLEVLVGGGYEPKTPKPVIIINNQGAGMTIYQVDYAGPGNQTASQLVSVPITGRTSFTNPSWSD